VRIEGSLERTPKRLLGHPDVWAIAFDSSDLGCRDSFLLIFLPFVRQDDCVKTLGFIRLLAPWLDIPIIPAGGIMDGVGSAASLRLGASVAQLGTAFVACTESDANAGYREALAGNAANHTVMTLAIAGRPARCLRNWFTALGAAMRTPESGYCVQWARQGAPFADERPAA
jgi:nitronate monooxygenase